MGIDKCANCLHRTVPLDTGPCEGCNADNNSKNWVYHNPEEEQQMKTKVKRVYFEAKKSHNFQTYTAGLDVDIEYEDDAELAEIYQIMQQNCRALVLKQIERDKKLGQNTL